MFFHIKKVKTRNGLFSKNMQFHHFYTKRPFDKVSIKLSYFSFFFCG